ncbi:fatty acid--CoA ligase family protein [Sphingobium sp. AP49]|uniref:class I adenylate-forming enzyme family protein n=1 Tax=Sphingobium sp. AP49 TaxID=1144307 RepID=UPI00056669C9|nr:fatty acid--CoA ligase family protein [Sphingobium sp. AP49]WHO38925.1 fatty acid--CoA ligase family protein [Sphingobium sp. AP49]
MADRRPVLTHNRAMETDHPNLPALAAAALQRPADQPAIDYEGAWLGWGQLRAVADAIRATLDASGIAPDAPVAFVARNRPAALAALLGLIAQGRTIRMIYAFQAGATIARDLARMAPGALVAFAEDIGPDIRAVLEQEGIVAVAIDGMTAAALPGHARASAQARLRHGPAAPQIEILTSGTTGPPKSFAVPYALLERHFLSTPLTRQQVDDPQAAPPFLLYFPLGNITGLYSTLPMLLRGQRVELLERFSLDAWHAHVRRWRPSHGGLPPASVQAVLDAGIPAEDLASLRAIGCGAAPLDPGVQRAFEARYGIPILLSYGATEFAGPVASMTAALHAEWGASKIGSVGRAMAGAQLRIVDAENGAPLPPHTEGLLEVISPRIGPDWIRTADIGLIDTDGFLFLRGRADGAIIRGGFKLLPESIERALMLHPAVAEAAVTGMADSRLGQVPAAAIRLHPAIAAPSTVALEDHVRRHLPATHVPVKWIFLNDLPRTSSLKTDRCALQQLFADMSSDMRNETEDIT